MNINEALIKAYDILKSNDIESYMIDSQLLLCKVLNVEKLYIIINRSEELAPDKEQEFFRFVNLRSQKRPMAYILEQVEFMGIDFYIKEGVLIPRPDTEILVEECISIIKKNNLNLICDMCCGSGAIGISVGHYVEDSKLWLYDISEVALHVTEKNVSNLDLGENTNVNKSDLFQLPIREGLKFNMIVSNPPYIKEEVIPTLMEDVKDYEPHLALSGGKDGLDFYKRICREGKSVLYPSGYLCFEIGHDQEKEVKYIMENEGFIDIYSLKDLSQNYRVVIGKLP
ncbi:peptide chain release factor N(5)-glutamine methyltransferase [Clostridium sp. UBA1056]|uniref:peptide chain release factor N(5)-glutamine methyltransferase n=1 Tax=unclassified Clostridium TaxID=2614128 RepID=UPI0032163CC1